MVRDQLVFWEQLVNSSEGKVKTPLTKMFSHENFGTLERLV